MRIETKNHRKEKGFTLIELLIVVAIIAILATVVILVLNPAELLKEARDSTRLSDLSTLKSSISLYLASITSPSIGSTGVCYVQSSSTATLANCQSRYATSMTSLSTSTKGTVDGTGWIPINFSAIPGGSPIPVLPVDPVNNATYYYSYTVNATNLTFKLDAVMESSKYSLGGSSDVESTDGGTSSTVYETGTNLSL